MKILRIIGIVLVVFGLLALGLGASLVLFPNEPGLRILFNGGMGFMLGYFVLGPLMSKIL